MYSLSLKIADKVYTSSGETPAETLNGLEKPLKFMHKGILTMSEGDKKKVLLLQPTKIKRLYYTNPNVRGVIAKQLFSFLK